MISAERRELESRRVRVLDPTVAERIAAGEVVERPASVVKELLENSLDAGATEISIALEDGGKALIEILDNGHGIIPDDLPICALRHATSKLARFEDLETLSTLGFRGEALPSVAAVSDLQILSRAQGYDTAFSLDLGSVRAASARMPPSACPTTFGQFLGKAYGTRIQARSLFSQVPARLKFLKARAAEVTQVREWVERLALAHPHVGFRLVSDGKAVLALRPETEAARVQAILSGAGALTEDFPIVQSSSRADFGTSQRGALRARAYWLQGLSSPQMRKIVQVINGRVVRDKLLQQAIMTSFRQALLPGQFPAVALYLDLDPAEIDVNVHPSKTEIRFLDGRKVFSAVEKLLSSMIESHGAPAVIPARVGIGSSNETGEPVASPEFCRSEQGIAPRWKASEPGTQSPFPFCVPTLPERGDVRTEPEKIPSPSPLQAMGLHPDRFLGTFFDTYLFYDLGAELVLIDQHAAHERIRYEKLRHRALGTGRGGSCGSSQALLLPEATHIAEEDRARMEARLPWLEALGFEAEFFGETALLFWAVPTEWGLTDLKSRLRNLVERVLASEPSVADPSGDGAPSLLLDEILFERLASEACHSAVRAGDRLERSEALALTERLAGCEHPWNCPHGRPTVVRVAKGRIEEWFQRRI